MRSVSWNKKSCSFILLNGLLTAFFAVVMVFGPCFEADQSWDEIMLHPIFGMASFFCYWILFFAVSYALARRFVLGEHGETGGRAVQALDKKAYRRLFFLMWGLLMLMWLPYLIGFYPGIANYDVVDQLAQFFNFKNYFYGLVDNPISDEVLINGHHPVFNTWMQGIFLRLGILLGSQNLGVFIHVAIQFAFTTAVFAWSACEMRSRGVRLWKCMLLILIFGLIPCFPLYGINLVKNSAYSVWVYISVILLVRLAKDAEAFCKDKRLMALLLLSLVMQNLDIKHGIHVIFLLAVPFFLCYRRYWKYFLPVFVIPVLVVQVGMNSIVMPALKITPGSDREMYGFLYQQTARYVRDYPQDVTPEEREAIDGVLEFDKLAELYDPITSDPVKFEAYRNDQTEADRKAYFKAWFSQFKKHPGVYVEATISGCYGFFYPGLKEWYDYLEFDRGIAGPGDGFFHIYHPEQLKGLKDTLTVMEDSAKSLPVIGLFFRHGAYVWLALWCAMVFAAAGKFRYFTAMMPLLGNILVCILSPYNANTRYLLPVIYGVGFCLLAVFAVFGEKQRPVSESEAKQEM